MESVKTALDMLNGGYLRQNCKVKVGKDINIKYL